MAKLLSISNPYMPVSPFHLFSCQLLNRNIDAETTRFYLMQDVASRDGPVEIRSRIRLHNMKVLVSSYGIGVNEYW